jgi:hypothetical protein
MRASALPAEGTASLKKRGNIFLCDEMSNAHRDADEGDIPIPPIHKHHDLVFLEEIFEKLKDAIVERLGVGDGVSA